MNSPEQMEPLSARQYVHAFLVRMWEGEVENPFVFRPSDPLPGIDVLTGGADRFHRQLPSVADIIAEIRQTYCQDSPAGTTGWVNLSGEKGPMAHFTIACSGDSSGAICTITMEKDS